MDKNEFRKKLDEKVQQIEFIQPKWGDSVDKIKEKLIPIVLDSFLQHIPYSREREEILCIHSDKFEVKKGWEYYYLKIDGEIMTLYGSSTDSALRALRKEMMTDLSNIVGQEVKCNDEPFILQFYFYY